jgi:hypothetical protein
MRVVIYSGLREEIYALLLQCPGDIDCKRAMTIKGIPKAEQKIADYATLFEALHKKLIYCRTFCFVKILIVLFVAPKILGAF